MIGILVKHESSWRIVLVLYRQELRPISLILLVFTHEKLYQWILIKEDNESVYIELLTIFSFNYGEVCASWFLFV